LAAFDTAEPDEFLKKLLGEDETESCFYCGTALTGIAVFWSGRDDRLLLLHPTCARDLACHLIGDAQRAKQMWQQRFRPATVVATRRAS
jgi:hypothetical protein